MQWDIAILRPLGVFYKLQTRLSHDYVLQVCQLRRIIIFDILYANYLTILLHDTLLRNSLNQNELCILYNKAISL